MFFFFTFSRRRRLIFFVHFSRHSTFLPSIILCLGVLSTHFCSHRRAQFVLIIVMMIYVPFQSYFLLGLPGVCVVSNIFRMFCCLSDAFWYRSTGRQFGHDVPSCVDGHANGSWVIVSLSLATERHFLSCSHAVIFTLIFLTVFTCSPLPECFLICLFLSPTKSLSFRFSPILFSHFSIELVWRPRSSAQGLARDCRQVAAHTSRATDCTR